MQDYFAQTHPPSHAEFLLREAVLKDQRSNGLISASGKPQTLVREWEEIDPSVGRVLTYLYDNTHVHISKAGALECGLPNVTQLRVDLRWLIDQGLVGATIHKGKEVAFITPRGEDIIDDSSGEDEIRR